MLPLNAFELTVCCACILDAKAAEYCQKHPLIVWSSGCQVSKDARGEEKDSSPGKDTSTAKRSPRQQTKSEGEGSEMPKPDAPQITTLLEFIAWLALQWSEATRSSEPEGLKSKVSGFGWASGRGGFLADQLEAVQDASIRLQVLPCILAVSLLSEHEKRFAFQQTLPLRVCLQPFGIDLKGST